eukprot:TRINITY_DN1395_c0_g1_i1.p1 TRINITY_DN1395_c0_g1~~TRINITY_DN1395_c0_g1_i1.p1  ORF type:complete len:474 (-),score=61.69 TRINITY_DN1395_c0_g1_i1:119-1540(-)
MFLLIFCFLGGLTLTRAQCDTQPVQAPNTDLGNCSLPANDGDTCSANCSSGFVLVSPYLCSGQQWIAASCTQQQTAARLVSFSPANNSELAVPTNLVVSADNASCVCFSADASAVTPTCDAAHQACATGTLYSVSTPPVVRAQQTISLVACAPGGDSPLAVLTFLSDSTPPQLLATWPNMSAASPIPPNTTSVDVIFSENITLTANLSVFLAAQDGPDGKGEVYVAVPRTAVRAWANNVTVDLTEPELAAACGTLGCPSLGIAFLPGSLADALGNTVVVELETGRAFEQPSPTAVLFAVENRTGTNGNITVLKLLADYSTHICFEFEPAPFFPECFVEHGPLACDHGDVYDPANPPVINTTVTISAVACGFGGSNEGPEAKYTVSPSGGVPPPPSPPNGPSGPAPGPSGGAGSPSEEHGGISAALVAGLVVLAVAILGATAGFVLVRKRRTQQVQTPDVPLDDLSARLAEDQL